MPNHVTHTVTFTGPEAVIAAFAAACLKDEPNTKMNGEPILDKDGKPETTRIFDFNGVIPMPEILRDSEESSVAEDGMLVLLYEQGSRAATERLSEMLDYPWVKTKCITTIKDLVGELKARPGVVKAGEQALKCIAETGYKSWYRWSIDNWGTKWNAYSLDVMEEEPTEIKLRFDTAWGSPTPVFKAIGAKFPELKMVAHYFDEGWHFAGTAQLDEDGFKDEPVKPDAESHLRAYGYVYEEEEEEEDA